MPERRRRPEGVRADEGRGRSPRSRERKAATGFEGEIGRARGGATIRGGTGMRRASVVRAGVRRTRVRSRAEGEHTQDREGVGRVK